MRTFTDSIHARAAGLDCFWGFADRTLKGYCRPGQHQRKIYNGHKRCHGIKYQSASTTSGMIAYLFRRSRHNSVMLAFSGLLQKLQLYSHDQYGNDLCIYSDPAYPLRRHLQDPITVIMHLWVVLESIRIWFLVILLLNSNSVISRKTWNLA